MINRTVTIIIIAITLQCGCTPTRVSDKVSLNQPTQWRYQPDQQIAPVELKKWWQGFGDSLLCELIKQALTANHDIIIAKSRVREAAAIVTVAESALYPSFDLFASGGREKKIDRIVGVPGNHGIELITPTGDSISGGLTAHWEIDLFGGRHLEVEAVYAQAAGSEESLRAVQVGLLAQVATNYLELRGVQKRITIQRQLIAVHHEKLRALRAFKQAGSTNGSDISGQETLLHSAETVIPALSQSSSTLMNRLGVLLGVPPASLEKRLNKEPSMPIQQPGIPKLLPADLLTQRPDLRLAKTEVSAAASKLGAARADLFPKIQLSASVGFGALAVGGFPSLAESIYTLGTGLTAPIFNAGRIKSFITAADARLDQAAANYEKTFLLALEDVENAYVSHTTAQEQHHRISEASLSAEQTHREKETLYRLGAGDYLSVLDAQKNQLAVEGELSKTGTALYVSLVSLYRAFGGGWSVTNIIN